MLLHAIADAAATRCGHPVVFHPHAATFVETPAEIDRLAGVTDPAASGICLDVGHHLVGGGRSRRGDPSPSATGSRTCTSRTSTRRSWHGCRPASYAGLGDAVRDGLFTELGAGMLDLDGVLAAPGRARLRRLADGRTGPQPGVRRPRAPRSVGACSARPFAGWGRPPHGRARGMRVALLGAGRIGRLHARLLRATAGVDSVDLADADPARAAEVAAEAGVDAAPIDRRRVRRRRCRRHRRRDERPRRADPRVDRPWPADLLREAARRHPRRDDRARRRHRALAACRSSSASSDASTRATARRTG